jgi:hypothetical protein
MKQVLFVALLALALPLAAFANSQQDFNASGGNVGVSSSGVTYFSSTDNLTEVLGWKGGGSLAGDLGSMSFSTGALLSTLKIGSTTMIQTFAGGGNFTITGNGTQGLYNGVIFKGTFSGDVTLITFKEADGKFNEILECTNLTNCSLTGTWYNGKSVSGGVILTNFGGVNAFTGFQAPTVPEPSTLGLLGTGLLGLGALVRRKMKA